MKHANVRLYAGLALLVAAAPFRTSSAQTGLVSLDSTGGQAPLGCDDPHVTPDGRWVVFRARSPLVPEDSNGNPDVYVRDLQTGQTILVSRNTVGDASDGTSDEPSISDDGRFIVFTSTSNDLGPGSTPYSQVFLRDMQTGINHLVSAVPGTGQMSNFGAGAAEISGDGNYVVFRSRSSNLLGSTSSAYQVFRCRVQPLPVSGLTMISVTAAGLPSGSGVREQLAISRDGSVVAFSSDSSDLFPTAGSISAQVYVYDALAASRTCITKSILGAGIPGSASSLFPVLSADGNQVAFSSFANDLVSGDAGLLDIFVHDRVVGSTTRVSVDSNGLASNGSNGDGNTGECGLAISPEGRFVAFRSSATNLDFVDTYTTPDIFLHDLQTGTTRMVGLTQGGGVPSGGGAVAASLSSNAQRLVFESGATSLLLPQVDANGGTSDVFYRELGDPLAPTGTCFGDGSGATCPCGNQAPQSARIGCTNSLGTGGLLGTSGQSQLSADTLTLQASQMPSGPALYFQGSAILGGGAGSVFGDGLRCAGGMIVRLKVVQNVAGSSQYPAGGDVSASVRGLVSVPGSRVYQTWYRDSAAYCTASTFNLTNGVMVAWRP